MIRISSKNLFQGALNQRQFDEHQHRFKWLRSQRLPTTVVDASSRSKKEGTPLDPVGNPRLIALPLLKLSLTRHGPGDKRLAHGRKMHEIDDTR